MRKRVQIKDVKVCYNLGLRPQLIGKMIITVFDPTIKGYWVWYKKKGWFSFWKTAYFYGDDEATAVRVADMVERNGYIDIGD